MDRRKIVAGNWKMMGNKASISQLTEDLKKALAHDTDPNVETLVLPPFIYIEQVAKALANTVIVWGAQNVSANEPGPYTGEIAANMLVDFNCRYVLVGHSERRRLYHEDDILIAMKFAQAQRHNLIPILCVGETEEEYRRGLTKTIIDQQMDAVLNLTESQEAFSKAVIAYEPVWAIGTGLTATPEQAQEVHQHIRKKIADLNPKIADNLPILYGGSVRASNAGELFEMPDIDGGLVGGASLNATEFIEIIKCIKSYC